MLAIWWRQAALSAAILTTVIVAEAGAAPAKATWRIHTDSSLASGHESCFVSSTADNQPLFAVRTKKPGYLSWWTVFLGTDNHPGYSSYLLVDEQRFQTMESAFSVKDSEAIVAALKAGKMFAFEWTKWRQQNKRGSFLTGNFAARAAECEKRLP